MDKEEDVRLQYLYPNFEIYIINLIWGTFSDGNQHHSISAHGARGKQWNSCCMANPSPSPACLARPEPGCFSWATSTYLVQGTKFLHENLEE